MPALHAPSGRRPLLLFSTATVSSDPKPIAPTHPYPPPTHPATQVRRVVNQIIRFGRVVRPSLGIHCASGAQSKQLNLPGVLVIDVSAGSAAESAGLRRTSRDRFGNMVLGDVITEVDGQRTQTAEDLLAAVEGRNVGEEVVLTVQREGGKSEKIRCKLQERKDTGAPLAAAARAPLGGGLGRR